MFRIMLGAAVAAMLALVCAVAPAAKADEPVKIRIGWAQAPGHLAPLLDILAQKHPEVMPHQAKTYAAEAVRFAGSMPTNTRRKRG